MTETERISKILRKLTERRTKTNIDTKEFNWLVVYTNFIDPNDPDD